MKRIIVLLFLTVMCSSVIPVNQANASPPLVIEKFGEYSEGLISAGVWDGKWKYGFVNARKEWVIQPQFDHANGFHEGFAVVGLKEQGQMMYGYIRKDGSYLIRPQFQRAYDFSGGYAEIGAQTLVGLIDKNAAVVLDIAYLDISGYRKNLKDKNSPFDLLVFRGENGAFGFAVPGRSFQTAPVYESIIQIEDWVLLYQRVNGVELRGMYFLQSGKLVEPKYADTSLAQRYHFDVFGVAHTVETVGILVQKDSKKGLLDLKGNEVVPVDYDELWLNEANRIIARKNNQTTILRLEGTRFIDQDFDSVSAYHWRSTMIVTSNGKMGLIKQDGSYIVQTVYDDIEPFSLAGYAKVKLDGKFGVISRVGKEVLSPVYDSILPYDVNRIKVTRNGKEELLGVDYQPVGQTGGGSAAFDTIGVFEGGFARVTKGDKIGYVNEKMAFVVEPIYDSAYRSHYGGQEQPYFTTQMGNLHGAVTLSGEVIEPIYSSPPHISEGIALVGIDGRKRYLRSDGTFLNNETYVYAEPFNEGIGLFATDDWKRGFVDVSGKRVHGIYENASGFQEGLAFIYTQKEGGFFINHEGAAVIGSGMNLISGYPFKNGIAGAGVWDSKVSKRLYGVLKKDGTWLVTPRFDQIQPIGIDEYKYLLNGKSARITLQGEIIWE